MEKKLYLDVALLEGQEPGIRYTSHLNVYTEVLHQGRLLCNLRSVTGRAKTQHEDVWDSSDWLAHLIGRNPVESFQLELDGQSLHSHWKLNKAYEIAEKNGETKHGVIELEHEIRLVQVKVHTRISAGSFIERWLEITNTSTLPAVLSDVSPASGFLWYMENIKDHTTDTQSPLFSLGYFADSEFRYEGDFAWKALTNGKYTVENKTGRSGWGSPFFMLKNRINGEVFTGYMEWSTNWYMEFTVEQEASSTSAGIFFKMGPKGPAPLRVLAPGETIQSPAIHLGHQHADDDGCVQEAHRYVRSLLLPKITNKELLVGNGRVVGGELDWLKREIDLSAETGMEYFMVDAGWYGTEFMKWADTVGDWTPGEWLEGGLAPIREYIHEKGMLFGLWVEPEAVGSRSLLLQEHPDWVVHADGKPVGDGRLLDLSKPEVASWIEQEMFRIIEVYKPDMLKIDFNCFGIKHEGENLLSGYLENTQWKHTQNFYAILDKLNQAFPEMPIENCASGGGRNDLGTVRRAHISCQSDYTIIPRSLKAFNNLTLMLPPEMLRYYFGHWPGFHLYGDYDFQVRTSLMSNPIFVGLSPNTEKLSEALKDRLAHHLNLYRSFIRPIMPDCLMYHHTPYYGFGDPQEWCVTEYMAQDLSKGYAFIFKMEGKRKEPYILQAKGLNPGYTYKVTLDNSGHSYEIKGYDAMTQGIRINLTNELTSELVLFEKQR